MPFHELLELQQANQDLGWGDQIAVDPVQRFNAGGTLVDSFNFARNLAHVQFRHQHHPHAPEQRFDDLAGKGPESNKLEQAGLDPRFLASRTERRAERATEP